MANQISMKNAVVLAKIETTSGTEQAPSATDAILCTDVQIDPLAGSAIDINYVRPYFGGFPSMRVDDFVTCSLTCDLVGNATPATPGAPYDALLRSCGTAKTALAAVASTALITGSTTTTLRLAASASATDNFYVGQTVQVTGFPDRTIVGYAGSTKTATVHKAYATAPGTVNYTIAAASQYTPASTGLESCTLYFNQGGLLHKLIGARGNASLDMSANGRPIIKFDMIGMFSQVTDAASSATYIGWGAPQTVNTANTWAIIDGKLADGSATGIQAMNWSMDFGNAVKHRQLIGSESVPITDRVTKGATSIELTTVGFRGQPSDWWIERIRTATKSVLAVENGLTLGNIVNVWMPNVQLMDPKYSDSDGIVMLDMNYNAIPLVGNDEFRLIFK